MHYFTMEMLFKGLSVEFEYTRIRFLKTYLTHCLSKPVVQYGVKPTFLSFLST